MMRLYVPRNEQGMKSHNAGLPDSENLIKYVLSENEYFTLFQHRVFDILNDKFDLWIDNGESEEVTAEQLKSMYKAISPIEGVWLEAVNSAIKYKTCVFLDF